MCVVKTPKIKSTTAADTADSKPLQVLRNPLLDGIDSSINSLRIGRNNLRVDRNPTARSTGIQTPLSIAPMGPQIGVTG